MASGADETGPGGRERDAALADALDEGARVLMRLAARLRALHALEEPAPAAGAAAPALPRAHALGQRQLAVLGLGGFDDRLGMAAGEVAKALGYTPSNATNLLKRLEEREHLVRVPGERPARWRRPGSAGA